MTYTVHQADVLEALRALPSDSFHGSLTDPPYGLTTDGGKTGFMGHAWDKGVPPAEVWAEVLRVLRPGAYLLAFGGTRTFHRLTCAIEDAGFEIRDSIAQFFDQDAATQAFLAGLSPEQRKNFDRAFVGSPIAAWCFGSGFPKSHNVSAAIDREAGAVREVVGQKWAERYPNGPGGNTFSVAEESDGSRTAERTTITAPATEAARQWSGYGSALKPAHESIIVARKPLVGTIAQNVQAHGCGALAIDASRIGTGGGDDYGRSAANATGTVSAHGFCGKAFKIAERSGEYASALGRWPANVILDEEAGAALDAQSGVRTSGVLRAGTKRTTGGGFNGGFPEIAALKDYGGDSGGASRFFKQCDYTEEDARFFYCAKASRKERDAGVEGGNGHPCVKPLALTTYLARLILPPVEGSRLLVPFCGSGSEMLGGTRGGWSHVEGIDSWDVAVKIARARLAHHEAQAAPANDEAGQLTLDGVGT